MHLIYMWKLDQPNNLNELQAITVHTFAEVFLLWVRFLLYYLSNFRYSYPNTGVPSQTVPLDDSLRSNMGIPLALRRNFFQNPPEIK
jgi:hypothetical protein